MSVPTYQQILDSYKAALLALSTAQSYTINGRTVTRANLGEIQQAISWLEQRIAAERCGEDGLGFVQITVH